VKQGDSHCGQICASPPRRLLSPVAMPIPQVSSGVDSSISHFVLYFFKDETRCPMTINTYEGVVEKGKIRLKSGVKLPENVRVYVIVTDLEMEKKKPIRVLTPRLARRGQAAQFKMRVSKEKPNA